VAGQGSLLGFLRRAPLAAANDIANARELDSPTVAEKRERLEPTDVEGTAGDPAVEAAAGATTSDAAEGGARAPARLRPPVRMADALERIARNVERWATVFVKLEDATVDVAAHEEARARRDADARAALSKRAYEYRLRAYARTSAFYDARVEDETSSDEASSDAETVFPARDARKRKPRRFLERFLPDASTKLRRADAFGLSLTNLHELGVTHLPRARRETTAAAAYGDPAVSVAFDASGSFLAAACASGGLCVLPFDTLRVSDGERFQPVWTRRGLGDSGSIQRTVSSVAWGGGGEENGGDRGGGVFRESAFLATTSPDSDVVEVLDARVGRTARAVSSSGDGVGTGSVFASANAEGAGLLDVCFVPGAGGTSFVASGRKGRVFLWDARCAGAPRATLHAPGASAASSKAAVHCVRVGCDGQTVLAGTAAGEIHVWDLRGGSGGGGASKSNASAFSVASRRQTSFPVLRTARVADSLALAPTLRGGHLDATAKRAWQSAMRSGVHWCEQDPHDPRRVGFHLASGWLRRPGPGVGGGRTDGDARALPRAAVRAGRGRRRAGARARALAGCVDAQAHGGVAHDWRGGVEVRGAAGRVSGNLRRARAGLLADAGGEALGRRRHRGGPRRRGAVRGARVSEVPKEPRRKRRGRRGRRRDENPRSRRAVVAGRADGDLRAGGGRRRAPRRRVRRLRHVERPSVDGAEKSHVAHAAFRSPRVLGRSYIWYAFIT
jgi:hypothetical protein